MTTEDKKETQPEMEVDSKPAAEEEAKVEEKKAEPEKPKELEEDAPADKRKKVAAGAVKFTDADATINLLSAQDGALLSSIGEGGCQYLLAGARATAGVKSGRYMFEVRIVETKDYFSPGGASSKPPSPHQLLRVGFSAAGSSMFMGESSASICFDSEGNLHNGKKRQKVMNQKMNNSTMAILLNLDSASPNKNTISLFRAGKRVCEPQPLPEELVGKTLFPTVAFRNMTVEVNMGPIAHCPLPFKCTMIGGAAQEDLEVRKVAVAEKGEILMPVGLPDQGLFAWIDSFLAKHPDYIELSDRKIIEWAQKSGVWKPKPGGSNDKPNMSFGLPLMDDGSIRRLLLSVAPVMKRKYIIGELKANLVPEERKALLAKFAGRPFKTVAAVVVGDPDDEYKKGVQASILADKQAKAEAEQKRKAQEAERKKAAEERAKKAKLAAQKKKDGEPAAEEEAKEEAAPAAEEPTAPVELTEEEKKIVHKKGGLRDLQEKVLVASFSKFSIPTKEEGFDEIKFLWQPQDKCEKFLTEYKHELKMTQKVENIKPSGWFKEHYTAWTKELSQWRKLQNEWKNPASKKKLIAKKEEELKAKAKEEGKEAPEPMKIDVEDLDVFAVDDINDVGTGEPIFANFAFADWALLSARYEAFLLTLAFKKDVDDPDRPSFSQAHYSFYYQKYFGKQFSINNFNCKTFADFVKLIKDTIAVEDGTEFVKVLLPEETPLSQFVKLVESHRRDRQRRADAGDESAILKFSHASNSGGNAAQSGGNNNAGGAKRSWGAQGGGYQPAWKQQRTNYQGGYRR
eukprot:TRINITY_DN9457_c0_g2_i1.p1 TRINITY_DN9457_c0_g2~~TRINITY_DN9457_c0_g2_i1.p1  ORF type:complete len:797 (-),score=272.82 TRINITY_DN9457_c0_g2_i1:183-2573(-)